MFENLNPIFQMDNSKNKSEKKIKNRQQRKTRNDKKHAVRIPVYGEVHFKFRHSYKLFKYHFPNMDITQTDYNTLLFRYALKHREIINWDMPYKGSEVYMTLKPLETEYEAIGGLNGLALVKGISERRAAYMATVSALLYIEKKTCGNMSTKR